MSTGPAGTVTVDAGYNAADQPKEVTVGALGASWTTSATYAKTHQPVSMTALGQTWRFGYSAPGALTQVASGRALRTRSYDTAGRLAAVSAGIDPLVLTPCSGRVRMHLRQRWEERRGRFKNERGGSQIR